MKKNFLQVLILLLVTVNMIGQIPSNLSSDDMNFFPEDIVIANNVAYVSGLGDGTLQMFDLNSTNPTGEIFAEAEAGYTQRWGVKSDGTKLLSILDNADFGGGESGPAKLVEYDIATRTKTTEWPLPAGAIGHTVSIVGEKYYVTDFGSPRIIEIDRSTGLVNDSWFTSPEWDPTISGIGGTIYDNQGGFYISQGNKLWYLPISDGTPGTLQQVTVTGLDIIDADGISWDDTKNILYFATNDTGDPENVGTVSRLVFSDVTTATGSVIASDLDDASGLWFHRDGGKEYIFVLESQFGGLFGINSFEPPFNIEIIELASSSDNTVSVYNSFEDATLTGGQQAFYGAAGPVGISDDVEFSQFINFYDIDLTNLGLTMTLFNNSDAADLLLPEGRFDRYYFAYKGDMSNISISGGSPGLAANATVTALPAGYTVPVNDAFGTGYPLPITLPDGGFVVELGGGTDLTELGQTLSVDFGLQGVSVYNSFEDATLTGGQQAFYGAAGPVAISDGVEFPKFINFYDIDVDDCGLTMTLFNNSDAADVLLPEGRFDRYYFALEQDMSNISISGGSSGLTANATVTALPAGYEIPLADLFGTGYPLPITLPNGGFVLELGGGTDLTELGQMISVSFGCPTPESLTIEGETFFPEDIVIANNIAYVSGLGDGTLRMFNLNSANPTSKIFAEAEAGYTQRWGVKSDGTTLLSILDNADFGGGESGPAKLVAYDIASKAKTGEWDLPAGSIGHTVSIVDGKYYVTDFGQPRIFEIDPTTGTVNDSWFTSSEWDPAISGIGGTIYDNEGGFYISQGNKLWYLPISGGAPGTLQEVTVNGLDVIDADGISWDDANNTLYYATNDTGDPANVGTVYRLVFSDFTTATGSVIATGFDDSSGLWYHTEGGKQYIYVLESQFGALFGINGFEPPFNIAVLELSQGEPSDITTDDMDFFPEDIVISNNVAYVSGLGDGTLKMFNLNLANPTGEIFAEAEEGYTQRWGVKTDGTTLLSLLNNANFAGGDAGPAKLVAYDLANGQKTGEWDLPAGSVGHTVSIVDGKYYVTDFNNPQIFEVDSSTGIVNDSWFTSDQWDPAISGMGGTIYDGVGGFYVSQGNKLWYLPISGGMPGTLQQVTVTGLDAIDADGISWDDANNTLYYVTNDTGDPADVGTAYRLVFSDVTTATGSVVADGFDDSSGLWFFENNNQAYLAVLESQFGALFGINGFEPPFNIAIIPLGDIVSSTDNLLAASTQINVYPNPFKQMTTFEIELSQGGDFQFQVFDISGKEVANSSLELNEGTNQFNFNGSSLNKGFYSYRLSNRQGFVSGKMIVVK